MSCRFIRAGKRRSQGADSHFFIQSLILLSYLTQLIVSMLKAKLIELDIAFFLFPAKTIRVALIAWACFLFGASAVGQTKISFDKVTLEDLTMSVYPQDTAASAVILMDLGYFDGNSLMFTRKMRVKILTKSGLDWGNRTFNTPTKGDFKVVTYNLEDGKIVSEKADSKSIHTEEVIDGVDVYKVFAPNVKVGSVIDITYTHLGLPFEWRFQERVPVVVSELILEPADYITYNKTMFGFQQVETISPSQWRARNMPAFHDEPFLNDYSNYITRFEFRIESFGVPGRSFVEFSTTWKAVIDKLLDHSRFGTTIRTSPFLNEQAKALKAKNLPKRELIQAAYDYVQENLKWNNSNSLLASSDLRNRFLESHNGTSADINLTLIALLNKLDIVTYPVVLSTRENGLLVSFAPDITKLDYVIGIVQDGDIELFLDGTSKHVGTPGILPARCLNGPGLLVKQDNEQWLELNKNYTYSKRQFVDINMDESGSVKAKVHQDFLGFAFVEWMNKVSAINQDKELIKNGLQKEFPDISVEGYELTKTDAKALAGKEIVDIDLTGQLLDAGGGYIFTPFVMNRFASNPFKSEERKYPVDLNYPMEISTTITMSLPKGVSVGELPPSVKLNNADRSATFIYLASASGSNLQFRAVLKITKNVFTESEYKDLRVFFSEVVKKLTTPVELNRT